MTLINIRELFTRERQYVLAEKDNNNPKQKWKRTIVDEFENWFIWSNNGETEKKFLGAPQQCIPTKCASSYINNGKDKTKCCKEDTQKNGECAKEVCANGMINNPKDDTKCCKEDSQNVGQCAKEVCDNGMINNPKDETKCCIEDITNLGECAPANCDTTLCNF